jgi:hypothetical protein
VKQSYEKEMSKMVRVQEIHNSGCIWQGLGILGHIEAYRCHKVISTSDKNEIIDEIDGSNLTTWIRKEKIITFGIMSIGSFHCYIT